MGKHKKVGRPKGSKNKSRTSGMVKRPHTCPCVKSRESGKCHARKK